MMANTALFGGMMGEHTVYDLQSGTIRSYRTVCNANAEEPCNPYWSHVEETPVNPQIQAFVQQMQQFEQKFPGFLGSYSKELTLYDFQIPQPSNSAEWNVAQIALDQPSAGQPSGARYYQFEDAIHNWLNSPNAPEQITDLRSLVNQLNGVAAGITAGGFGLSGELNWREGSSSIDIKLVLTSGIIDITYDAVTQEIQIKGMRDRDGNPFPARYSNQSIHIDFGTNVNAAGSFRAALEGAGIAVERVGYQYIGPGTSQTAYLNCWYVGGVLKGCEIVYHQN